MNYTIPSIPGIVHDDVDLSVAELGCLLDELVDVRIAQHVTRDCKSAAAGVVDVLCHLLRLGCNASSAFGRSRAFGRHTGVDVRDDHARALVGE